MVIVHGDWLAVAVGEFFVAFVDGGWAVSVAKYGVAFAGEWAAHEVGPWGAGSDFAAVFEFVACTDWRFHRCPVLPFQTSLDGKWFFARGAIELTWPTQSHIDHQSAYRSA